MLREELPQHMELHGAEVQVLEVLGEGGFGKVVSASLTLPGIPAWTTAIKVMKFKLSSGSLPNVASEVCLAARLGHHPSINACVAWTIVGDGGSNDLLLDALSSYVVCDEDEVLVILVLSELFAKDLWSYIQDALQCTWCPPQMMLVSGLA